MRLILFLSALSLASASVAAPSPAERARLNAWEAGQRLAGCYLAGDRKRIEAALLADPASGAFEQWTAQRDKTCPQGTLQPQGDLYRFAVAEALFRRDLRKESPPNFAAIPRLTHTRAAPKLSTWASAKDRDQAAGQQQYATKLSMLGECIVRGNPAGAHAVLSAEPASDGETAAFKGLMPALERCIDQTKPAKVALDDVRGTIAVNYFRLAKARPNGWRGAAR